MTAELLDTAASILGDVSDEFVFVGGATVDLFITEAGGTTTRPTVDVDVIVEVSSRAQYELVQSRADGIVLPRMRQVAEAGFSR